MVAVKELTLPIPDAPRPIEVLLLLQVKAFPVPEKLIAELFVPLQMVILGIVLTVVVGFTVMLKFIVCPTHVDPPFERVGVTDTIEDRGEVVLELVAVNAGIELAPFAANPIVVFPFTHENVVFKALLPNVIGFVKVLLQTTRSIIGFTVGDGMI